MTVAETRYPGYDVLDKRDTPSWNEKTRAVVEAGGTALAQDEASSVVWGMPGRVAKAGLCHAVLPVPCLAARALELLPGAAP